MISKRELAKILIIIPIVIFRKFNIFFGYISKEYSIAEYFLMQVFGGGPNRNQNDFLLNISSMFEVMIFSLLFGTYMQRDLLAGNMYKMIRFKSRTYWFLEKVKEIVTFASLYLGAYLGILFLVLAVRMSDTGYIYSFLVCMEAYVIMLLFTVWLTVIINIISLILGNASGFIIVYAFISFSTVLGVNFDKIKIINKFPILLKINPMYNTIIVWDFNDSRFWYSVLYYVIFTIICGTVFCRYINKINISIEEDD